MTRVLRWVIGGISILIFGCTVTFGQGATGQISGTVTDTSGAVLPAISQKKQWKLLLDQPQRFRTSRRGQVWKLTDRGSSRSWLLDYRRRPVADFQCH